MGAENGLRYPIVNREPPKKKMPGEMPIRLSSLVGRFENPIYPELVRDFPLEHQQKVRQLTWIEALIKPPTLEEPLDSRYEHTLQVTALTEAILQQNNRETKTGIVAAWVHDIATPAFGDVSMKVDPERLDEEANWQAVIGKEGYAFFERHGIDPHVITKTIINGGPLGEVLDIADRIAYTTSDIDRFQHGARQEIRDGRGAELLAQAAEHPDIGDIYQDVRIEGDQVYFANPERLAAFLKLRTILKRDFVDHPDTQGRDIAIGNIIRRHLKTGKLTPDMLRAMGDVDLFHFFANLNRDRFGKGYEASDYYDAGSLRSVYQQFVQFVPDVQKFDSQQDLNKAKEKMTDNSEAFIIGEFQCDGFDTGTNGKGKIYQVKNNDGQLVPLKEVLPDAVREIEVIEQETRGHYLFYKQMVSRRSPAVLQPV